MTQVNSLSDCLQHSKEKCRSALTERHYTARWLFSFLASYSYSCTSFSSIPAFAFGPVLFLMTVSASAIVRVLVKMWCECDRTDLFAGRTQGKDVMLLRYRE